MGKTLRFGLSAVTVIGCALLISPLGFAAEKKDSRESASAAKKHSKTANTESAKQAAKAAKAAKAETSELKNLRQKIQNLQKEMASTEVSRQQAADLLKRSEQSISQANRKLMQLKEQRATTESRLLALRDDQQKLERQIEDEQNRFQSMMRAIYIRGADDPLKVVLKNGDPNSALRDLTYYQYVTQARQQLLASLQTNQQSLEALVQTQDAALKKLNQVQQSQQSEKKKLEDEKKKRAEKTLQLSERLSAQRKEIDTLKQNEARLSKLIERIGRITTPSKEPRSKSGKSKLDAQSPGALVADPAFEASDFLQLKGRLPAPLRGSVMHRFGTAREETGVMWKGIVIKGKTGDAIQSIAAGRVVFADWLRGFGNLLIIDHGDGYLSLYAHNESLLKEVGDNVKGGETVASVGNTGGTAEPGLYFEMRHRGQPFDPMKWIKTP